MAPADRRYGTGRWQRVRKYVLLRDMHRCRIVPGCSEVATVADHIKPATLDMSDAMFYGAGNLRAACRGHNLARGIAPEVATTPADSSAVVTKDYTR
jgi:5-methylcytosine-specific restriction endonuclease McrA